MISIRQRLLLEQRLLAKCFSPVTWAARNLSWLPNGLTIFRMLATPLIGWQIAERQWVSAFACLWLAGVSDFFDGWLARTFQWNSDLGQKLDPIADKFLAVCVFAGLWWAKSCPTWLALLIAFRDLLIVGGAWWIHRKTGLREFPPLFSGKVSTTFQMIGALCLLANTAAADIWGWPFGGSLASGIDQFLISQLLAIPIAGATVFSACDYVRVGLQMLGVGVKKY
jgi:cardiolipin synthase (CMP-forming)